MQSRLDGPKVNRPFSTTGYAILRGLLDCEALIEARTAVNAALTGTVETGMNRIGNDLVPLRWCDPCVALILNRPAAMNVIIQAIGARDLRWISAYITSKAPHSPPLFWHQDWWCWDHPVSFDDSAPQVALLCYLSETSAQTGALRVLPGSHRDTHDLHHHLPDPHSAEAHALPLDHMAMMDCEGQETISLAPGDAAVIDYRLLHGTHPNTASLRRDALLLSFAPAWRILPETLRAHIAMHPALPRPEEWPKVPRKLRRQLARYDGTPRSLRINRAVPLFGPSMESGKRPSALASER